MLKLDLTRKEYDELRIVGYDTQTETMCYDQTFPIVYDQFEGEFCIDANHNIYLLTTGSTEEECKSAGTEYRVFKSFFRANGKAVCMGETDGLCKLLAGSDGKIIGCHVLGPHAADLVQEISSLMSVGATVDGLRHSVHIHPTLSEVLLSAVE